MIHEERCGAPHKTVRGWVCRGLLFRAGHDGEFSVEPASETAPPPAGCKDLICPKCGAEYRVCGVPEQKRAA